MKVHTRYLLIGLFAGLGLVHERDAHAVTFGDTATTGAVSLTPCAATVVTRLAVTVDVSSRIYVNANAPFSSGGNSSYNSASYDVLLRDAADTMTLASVPITLLNAFDNGANITHMMNSSGVLYNGTAPYSAAPGDYLLEFVVTAGGSCSGSGPVVFSSSLSYILLSSVLDRIFANGFSSLSPDAGRYDSQPALTA